MMKSASRTASTCCSSGLLPSTAIVANPAVLNDRMASTTRGCRPCRKTTLASAIFTLSPTMRGGGDRQPPFPCRGGQASAFILLERDRPVHRDAMHQPPLVVAVVAHREVLARAVVPH